MSIEQVREALPYLIPKINRAVVMAVELEDTTYSSFAKGTPKEINSLGARQVIQLRVNSNYGNQQEGDYFREPGKHNAKQAIIGFTRDAITHGANGDYFENVEGDAIGGKLADLMKQDVAYMKKQRDIDFCHGDGKGTRGLVASITGTTIVTFTAVEGTRFLDEGETYFFHDPATGIQHGATLGHVLVTIDSTTQATFVADLTDNTDVLAGDVAVHKGTADSESSFNRALYGFDYFFAASGAYFGLNKDTESKLRGIRVTGGSSNISFTLLQKGITKWQYRWNMGQVTDHVDYVSPAQVAVYMTLGYALRRIDGNATSFDGSFLKISDGHRTLVVDANINPTVWNRVKNSTIERYEFKPTGVWDKDGLRMRAPQGNGSIQDSVFWVINGKEQMFCNNPAMNIQYYALGTSGVDTGV